MLGGMSSELCVIEPATQDDLPALVALLGLLFSQEAEFSPEPALQEKGLRLILTQPSVGQVWVVRLGTHVVGMCCLLFSVSTALGARVAWLEDVVLHPSVRQRGCGAAMLAEVLRQAEQAGCERLSLLTDGHNVDAQRFYTRLGFTTSGMRPMRCQLIHSAESKGKT
jgi:ribosomal protein S18 acetylase RimI-like enzyme